MKTSVPDNANVKKVAIASLIGTSIEWYDFFLYGTAAALIFNRLFFPTFDPLTGTLAALGSYAVGFAARPVGGIICGHFGDRVGRRSMLVITLLLMGVATFLIGLLPTYDQVGILSPILLVLLRIAQGFGLGGEWGGAVLMAVEHSPKGKRGFYRTPRISFLLADRYFQHHSFISHDGAGSVRRPFSHVRPTGEFFRRTIRYPSSVQWSFGRVPTGIGPCRGIFAHYRHKSPPANRQLLADLPVYHRHGDNYYPLRLPGFGNCS
jgi:hypothetical protein